MPKKYKRHFTLLELIVAMGVFMLILTMIARIFTDAQKLWSSSESRVSVYGSANIALSTMQQLIINSAQNYRGDYGVDNESEEEPGGGGGANPTAKSLFYVPMGIEQGSKYDSLDLCTEEFNMSLAPGTSSDTYFVRIHVATGNSDGQNIKAGDLVISAIGNNQLKAFNDLLDDVAENGYTKLDGYMGDDGTGVPYAQHSTVISNVMSLKFTFLIANDSGELESTTDSSKMPIAVVIDMALIDPETYLMAKANRTSDNITNWNTDGSDLPEVFRAKYLQGIRKFSRTVYLGRPK